MRKDGKESWGTVMRGVRGDEQEQVSVSTEEGREPGEHQVLESQRS